MIDPQPLLKIAPLFALALIVPGPDFLMMTSMTFMHGRTAGCLAAIGIACGNTIYASLSVLGLGVIFTHVHWLAVLVRICGGLYLAYLGFLLWKESFQATETGVSFDTAEARQRKNPFLVGFMTNMTNPKAMAFFTSIFAVALPTDAGQTTQLALIGMITIMSLIWFGFVAVTFSAAAFRKTYLRWSRWIDRIAGTCLGLFGMRLLLSTKD